MQPKLLYIELKSGYSDNGPAWIGKAQFSKSGQTIYFNGQAFKKTTRNLNPYSNYYDLETQEEYWISGIKKNGEDRHWAGNGKIMIDREIVDEYLSLVNFDILDKSNFELVNIKPTDKQKFAALENEKL